MSLGIYNISKLNAGSGPAFAKCLLPIFVLTTIVLLCFGRSLGSYFVADDFGQIAYAAGICNGNWQALLANFTGNYMQLPTMSIYRPLLLLSLVFDYIVWHTNAFGYFLTNILFLIASAIMLYCLLRQLTNSWSHKRSILFSLLSASLFASSPLHCESISFISGRDNVISAFFYLLSLWCFVRKGSNKNKKLLIIGIISFWAALLSKEMAIGLPLVLTGIAFFLPEIFKATNKYSLKDRCLIAIQGSKLVWLNAMVYLLVRYLALGTFTGGYTGGLGAGLMSNMFQRWTNFYTILRIVYPLNSAIFGVLSPYYCLVLTIIYTILATLVLVKFLNSKYSLTIFGLLILWAFTTIAPIYQMWGLGENLQGSRFYFFLTLPLAIFLPLITLAPPVNSALSESTSNTFSINKLQTIEALSVVAISLLIILSINITGNNNIAWLHAAKQTRTCLRESQKLGSSIAAGKKVALLGLPKEQNGAHAIYNGSTFNVMLSAPFSKINYTNKFITFDPLFYGLPDLVNAQRLKTVLTDPTVIGLFVWNEKTLMFDSLPRPNNTVLTTIHATTPITFQKTKSIAAAVTSNQGVLDHIVHQICINDHGLLVAPLSCNPYQYDFLEFKLKTLMPKELVFIFWKGDAANALEYCDSNRPLQKFVCGAISPTNIRIRLSDHWQWFTQGNITRLQLEFMPGQSVQVDNIHLISAKNLEPALSVVNMQSSNTGVYSIKKDSDWLNVDASAIKDCTAVKIEISKPNYFFDGIPEEESNDAIMTSVVQHTTTGLLHIPDKVFASPGYYQLRALGLDKTGLPIGERSDPITITYAN